MRVLKFKNLNFTISSSLLDLTPNSLLIEPINYIGNVTAVIELVSLGNFSDYQKEYIKKCTKQLAVSLHSLQQNVLIQSALQESKIKSEELQNQQKQLKVINEELMRKGDTLQIQAKELELTKEVAIKKAEELEKASKYKSEFLANMSHELRTPLNSLLILSKSLVDNEEGNLNKDELESAQIIQESGKNLLDLINDILDLSKIEAGYMEVHKNSIELKELANSLKRNFNHIANDKDISFSVNIKENTSLNIISDEKKLNQILVNLISNALKFTNKSSVRVDIFECEAKKYFNY